MSVEDSQDSLFAVDVEMVREPPLQADEVEPETWTPERKEMAHALLRPWWASHGTGWSQPYKFVFRTVMAALVKGVPEKKVRERLEGCAVAGETVTIAALAPKRQRTEPKTWTPDRKVQAREILLPWWTTYGNGWPQSYGVVFGVIVACLSQNVTPEDIKRALLVLGPERKPISGGTIGFALSRSSRQVAEEAAFAAAATVRSAEKYTQRTM